MQNRNPKLEGPLQKFVAERSLLDETSQIKEYELNKNLNPAESGVYLFFSFDISNSTAFKVEYPHLWGSVVTQFYSEVLTLTEYWKNLELGSSRHLWKLIGDEVLLYMQVYKTQDLYIQVKEIGEFQDQLLKRLISRLKEEDQKISQFQSEEMANGCNQKCSAAYGHCQDIEHNIKSMLGVKVTMWVAQCYKTVSAGKANIIYRTDNGFGLETIDFLGRDIDEGFRIAHETPKNKLIVSPLLAWLIWKYANEDSDQSKVVETNFKITAFRKLKGVWNDRLVPIVMYHQKFSEFDQLLEYDDIHLPVYENLKDRDIPKFIANSRFNISRLDKIFKDIYRDQENETLYQVLRKQPDPCERIPNLTQIQNIHIACAIFTGNKTLLVHQDESRGLEFGCAEFNVGDGNKTWGDICKKGYKSKYNLRIELDADPIPVATYVFDKRVSEKNERILGIILIGTLSQNIEDVPSDWSEYDLQRITQLHTEDESLKAVDKFYDNALKCFEIFNGTVDSGGSNEYRNT